MFAGMNIHPGKAKALLHVRASDLVKVNSDPLVTACISCLKCENEVSSKCAMRSLPFTISREVSLSFSFGWKKPEGEV